jgi:predicted phosphodiesterase
MKLRIYSDLHIEFAAFEPEPQNADVVILAGDIHVGKKGIEWAQQHFPDQPVIYVLGNHEYYRCAYPKHLADLRQMTIGTNIHLLENDRVEINDVVFLGCTLWTDFELLGDPRVAGGHATERMTDYRVIRVSPVYRKLRSIDTAAIHRQSLAWLKAAFVQDAGRKIVVVTHHGPSAQSLQEYQRSELLSAAYVSNLDEFVARSGAALWVHGHVHNQRDYHIGGTRVVCNPRGYVDEPNFGFDPGLSIAVE